MLGKIRIAVSVFVVLCSPLVWASDCPLRYNSADLVEKLDEAQAAFARLDAATFTTAMEASSLLMPCLDEPVSQELAARFHRAEGLRLYAAGNQAKALSSLRAAKVIEPDYAFPEGLFPQGYALLAEYKELDASQPVSVKTPLPKVGTFQFDGLQTRHRPADRPTLFQHLTSDGATIKTEVVLSGMPLPQYAINPRLRNHLLAASVAVAVVAGGMYGYGWKSRAEFFAQDPHATRADLEQAQARTNLVFGLAGGLSAVSAAGVLGVVLVGER